MDFLETLNGKHRLPHISQVHIDSVPFVNSELRTFLSSTMTTCDEFYLNKKPAKEHIKSKIDIDYYLDSLLTRCKKGEMKTLLLGYFDIKTEQFNQLVKSNHSVEFLSFNCWKLHFDKNLDFELEGKNKEYSTMTIALTGWGKDFNGGILDEKGMEMFVLAISKWGLKDSLKHISVTWWNVSKETVTKYLADNSIEGIQVWA